MDGWLKALVAAACVAIVAGVGYYFYSEAQVAAEKAAQTGRIDGARRQLFNLAKAAPHETDKVRNFCAFLVGPFFKSEKDSYYYQLVANCRTFGFR